MAFTIRYRDVTNPSFHTSILKIARSTDLAFKPAYNVSRIIKMIDSEMETYKELHQKLLQKYAEKDENGELKIDKSVGKYVFEGDNEKAFTKEYQELLDVEFTVERYKIKPEDVEKVPLSPIDLTHLEPIMEPVLESVK